MQLIKTVTKSGNGAHILLPKTWIGDQVILKRKPKSDIKKQILSLIYPHLQKILGVYLYGSHARNEATDASDTDILIISEEKFKISHKDYDIIIIHPDKIRKAIKLNPILMYSIFQEAKPIINSSALKKYQNQKISKAYFKEFIKETKQIIKINKETISLDELTSEILESTSVIYSILLRLKGTYITKQLLKNKKYTNKKFQKFLKRKIPNISYQAAQDMYNSTKHNIKTKSKMTTQEAHTLNELLESEIKKLQNSK